jgi:uncharacterized protein DUF1843
MAETHTPAVPPYGVAIHAAIATGDLARMREMAQQAQQWIAEHGDVSAALETLKAEIARREAARR